MNDAFLSIKQGLSEAADFADGKKTTAVVHEFNAVDIKAIRSNLDLSQSEFAAAFGISIDTLKHWERGDRKPRGPALVLLNVIAKEPKLVLNALAE